MSSRGTNDSAWEMQQHPAPRSPLSSNMVEEWLHDCEIESRHNAAQLQKICLTRSTSGNNWMVVSEEIRSDNPGVITRLETPESHSEPVHKQNDSGPGAMLGHICSFLLGIGAAALFRTLSP